MNNYSLVVFEFDNHFKHSVMTKKELQNQLNEIITSADAKLLKILIAVSHEYNYEDKLEVTPSQLYSKPENSMVAEFEPLESSNDKLYRLVYTSARSKSCTDQDIEDILAVSRRNNPKLDITGIMVHTNDRFLQILEGPYNNIMKLYDTITSDKRHGGSIVRFCKPVDSRQFGDWNMAYKDVTSSDVKYRTNITEENRKQYESLMDGNLHSYTDEGMRVLKTFLKFS